MLGSRAVSIVPLVCALSLAACQDQGPTAPDERSEPPIARKGLFNGPGLRGSIAFQSFRSGNLDLFETDLGTGFVRQLTTSTHIDMFPYWWDRGRSLLFTSSRDGGLLEVYSLDVASGAVTRLTSDPSSSDPSGHRDLVAFWSNRDGDADIYLLDPATGFLLQLTNDPGSDFDPDLSPDGKYVVFTRNRTGDVSLWMVEVATGVTTQLTTGPGEIWPAFSPSGRQVAFVRDGDVWILDLRSGTEVPVVSSPASDRNPAWSPNGDFIAFSSDRDGDFDIYALHLESGALAKITNDPATDDYPTWKK